MFQRPENPAGERGLVAQTGKEPGPAQGDPKLRVERAGVGIFAADLEGVAISENNGQQIILEMRAVLVGVVSNSDDFLK